LTEKRFSVVLIGSQGELNDSSDIEIKRGKGFTGSIGFIGFYPVKPVKPIKPVKLFYIFLLVTIN